MRIFEIILLLTLIVSYFNLTVLKHKLPEPVLWGCSIIAGLLHFIFEGYRLPMVPLYVLAGLFLFLGMIRRAVPVRHEHKILKRTGITILTFILIIAAVLPFLLPVVNLMKPGGEYAVGTVNLEFTDEGRKGIFTADSEPRRIAVKVWYPAKTTKGGRAQKYFPNQKFGKFLADSMGLPNIFGQLALSETHSYPEAEIAAGNEKFPVILFSGGYGSFNGQNTIQMEELASHGYVVFGISHPYEDFASLYPDGSIIPANKEHTSAFTDDLLRVVNQYDKDKTTPEYERYLIEQVSVVKESVKVWTDDTIFTAEEIKKLDSGEIAGIFKGKLDTENMGVFGMSFGGAVAGESCFSSNQFKAFINMDGAPFGDTYNNIIKQPFMLLCSEEHKQELLGGYSPDQKNYLVVSVKGTMHYDFTDFTCQLPAFKYLGILGKNGGAGQERILNDYILSFFNKYLKGMEEPLLDGTNSPYAGVTQESR